jgi:choline kinase
MILLILASGRGSRLKELTKKRPKCLIKIKNKSIIKYLEPIFLYFNKIFIITGYKSNLIKKELNNKKIKFIKNKEYYKTNMVHSIFVAKKEINEDIIILYSDIIFDHKIISNLIKFRSTTLPLNQRWVATWRKRMNYKGILNDAENVVTKNKKIIEIGTKIRKNLPKLQFMGMAKITKQDYYKMYKLYKKTKDMRIDFTKFINLYIKKKLGKISYFITSRFWFEIDTIKDYHLINKKKFHIKS